MDEKDREIINQIQSGFPICERPYQEVATRVALSEDEVLERVGRLKQEGIIRRIGANFDSRSLNFTSTLCAARVPEEKLEQFVEVVNSYPGVTHNYQRNHSYNVWFTLIAPTMSEIEASLEEISRRTGVQEICNLPAVKMYKIKVDFPV